MLQLRNLVVALGLTAAGCYTGSRVVQDAADTVDYEVLLGRGEVFAVSSCLDAMVVVNAWIEEECLRWHAERDIVSEPHATYPGALGADVVGNAIESATGVDDDDDDELARSRPPEQPRDRTPSRRDVRRADAEPSICRTPAAGLAFEVDDQVFFSDDDGRFSVPWNGEPLLVRYGPKSWEVACDGTSATLRAPGPVCENPTTGLGRVEPIADPHATTLWLVRAMPEAFLTEMNEVPNEWYDSAPVEVRVAIRAVFAQLFSQWVDDVRSGLSEQRPVARVRALEQTLRERVENSFRTGSQPLWYTHGSELFPGYTQFSNANIEWMAFGRVVRGSTNCVGKMLLLAELADADVEVNETASRDGHWINRFETKDSDGFYVDPWTGLPPYASSSAPDSDVDPWEVVAETLATRTDGPMIDEAIDPTVAPWTARVCTRTDWQYGPEVGEPLEVLQSAAPPQVVAGERRATIVAFLEARVHHLYGHTDAALDAYDRLAAGHCLTGDGERIDPDLYPFCASGAFFAQQLRDACAE